MQPGINFEDVKKYNASLREYREKSTKLRAEIEFNQQELNRQCAELSKELGIEVTPQNIEQILAEKIAKINNTMSVGSEILNRIKAEEATMESANAVPTTVPIQGQTGASVPVMGQQGIPVGTAPLSGPTAPLSGPTAPNIPDFSGGLPPIFANK